MSLGLPCGYCEKKDCVGDCKHCYNCGLMRKERLKIGVYKNKEFWYCSDKCWNDIIKVIK